MATLTGNTIKDTYYKLVQVDDGQLVQNGIGSPLTGSIKLSGSLHVTGSQTVGGNLTVTGDVTARSFITQLTQSTVLYKSGSTAFGDDATDTHSFSGSVTMHNSLALGNYANVSASLDAAEDAIIANSQSAHTHRVALDTILSASVDTHLDANITALSSSAHSQRLSEDTVLSGSAHIQREAIKGLASTANTALSTSADIRRNELSSSNASALRAEYIAADNALSASQNTYINAKVAALVDSSPGTLDTLNELAAALGDDATFSASIATTIGTKLPTATHTAFSSSNASALRTEFLAGDTSLSSSLNTRIVTLESAETTATISASAHTQRVAISGALDTAIDNVISSNVSHSGGIVDLPGKKVQFSNVYATEGDLPTATDYHGMFAHVHATGLGYFAHGGNWVKLANSGSEASAVRAEYVAADTALSTSLATNISANTADISTLTAATSSYAASSSLYYVKRTLSQSISYDTGYVYKTLEYETGSIDQGGADAMWDTGSFRFTPTVSGLWYINSQVDVPDGSTAKLNIEKNGTVIASQRGTISGTPATFNASTHVVLNGSTDYIQFKANSQTGGTESQSPERAFFEALLVKEI